MQRPVTVRVSYVSCEFAQAHRLGMWLPFQIDVLRNGLQHLAGICGLAFVFSNKFVLDVHSEPSLLRRTAYRIRLERRRKQNLNCGSYDLYAVLPAPATTGKPAASHAARPPATSMRF